jgi:hypothetical protein
VNQREIKRTKNTNPGLFKVKVLGLSVVAKRVLNCLIIVKNEKKREKLKRYTCFLHFFLEFIGKLTLTHNFRMF